LIQHAYHIAILEESLAVDIRSLRGIVEFGGGYGGMCRLAYRLGFRGQYLIFDLPVFSALQRYFLESNGLATGGASAVNASRPAVACVSSMREFSEALESWPGPEESLVMATWSLSEAPLRMRDAFLAKTDAFGFFLIAYQERFEGVDNRKFFEVWSRGIASDFEFNTVAIQGIPGNWYLLGKRRRR